MYLTGKIRFDHLRILTREHWTSQTENDTHRRQQHEQRHLNKWENSITKKKSSKHALTLKTLVNIRKLHTTSVNGLLHDITPTTPEATTLTDKKLVMRNANTDVWFYRCSVYMRKKLTKKPAQKGQDCLTRGDEVKARLVKLKANTIAPNARWHKPR